MLHYLEADKTAEWKGFCKSVHLFKGRGGKDAPISNAPSSEFTPEHGDSYHPPQNLRQSMMTAIIQSRTNSALAVSAFGLTTTTKSWQSCILIWQQLPSTAKSMFIVFLFYFNGEELATVIILIWRPFLFMSSMCNVLFFLRSRIKGTVDMASSFLAYREAHL